MVETGEKLQKKQVIQFKHKILDQSEVSELQINTNIENPPILE